MRGFDTADHIQYVNYLKTNHRIPLPNEGWELHQAPLYYLIASLLPAANFFRSISLIAWLTLMITAYIFFSSAFKNRLMGMLGSAIVSSLPVVLYLSPTISNEYFSGVMSGLTIILYHFVTKTGSKKLSIIFGIMLGLSLLSKTTAFILIISYILAELLRNKGKKLWLPLLIALLIGGWFYLRNFILYGNPFAASADFPAFFYKQAPIPRDFNFFFNFYAFLKMDLFLAHHYSFIPGTFFSWFYDGHNVVIPVQPFSKAGALLTVASFPLALAVFRGYFIELTDRIKRNYLIIIYPLLLFGSYILYNYKLPYSSTVKGAFLVSAIIPFSYFIIRSIYPLKKFYPLIVIYFFLYILLVIKNFWILPHWYP